MLEEIIWTGKNKKEIEMFLNKIKEPYEIIEEKNPLLYISSIGGYIIKETTLFIYENRIYIKKEKRC